MDWLRDDGIFLPMINDFGRNNAYKKWLASCVQDKIVCDVGAGTGFLSILAVEAGASKVLAVEQNIERYHLAKSIIERLNLTSKIELVNDNFLNQNIQADYYVTETFGSAILDEGILNIAEHVKNLNGKLIPSDIEIYVKVYQPHPIFSVVQRESDASIFIPDIDINKDFVEAVNHELTKRHMIFENKNRNNWISNLFQALPKMQDLKLKEIFKSQCLKINFQENFPKLEINIPPLSGAGQYCIFWKAHFNNITMDILDTIWATPTRYINQNKNGVKIYYDANSWWFEW